MVLFIDNYDSFSFNLIDLFQQVGVELHIVKNDEPALAGAIDDFKGVIISPGPGRPEHSGYLMDFIAKNYARLPIFGVCLGMQALGVFFQSPLIKAQKPMHGKICQIQLFDHYLFRGLPEIISVTRYHSLVLESIPDGFKAISFSPEKEIMALAHRSLPICGVQFHPEAVLTEYGLQMIKNWVEANKIIP